MDDYGLRDNPDVLYSFADALYVSFRWADCFAITSRLENWSHEALSSYLSLVVG